MSLFRRRDKMFLTDRERSKLLFDQLMERFRQYGRERLAHPRNPKVVLSLGQAERYQKAGYGKRERDYTRIDLELIDTFPIKH